MINEIAVTNFLKTIDERKPMHVHISNLQMDAVIYRWNKETVKEILEGIEARYGEDVLCVND